MKKTIKVLIASVIAGILYRLGGTGGAWWKNTKVRDAGVAVVALITMLCLGASLSLPLFLSTLLLFGALTTYWKKLNPLFGKTTDNCYWWNWLATGLAYGLAYLPYAISTGCYWQYILRVIVLGVITMIWSEKISIDWIEENGRGAFVIATLPILFI